MMRSSQRPAWLRRVSRSGVKMMQLTCRPALLAAQPFRELERERVEGNMDIVLREKRQHVGPLLMERVS